MRAPSNIMLLLTASCALSGCATAPRSEAGRISDAGVKASATLQTEITSLSDQLSSGSVTEAFVKRWQACRNTIPAICAMDIKVDPVLQAKRENLALAVQARAKALSALGAAYLSLKQEADFDSRAEVRSATNEAVAKVNEFAGIVFALSGAPTPTPVLGLIGEAAGIFADQRQRGRILAANAKLRDITRRLHDALRQEAIVFDTIANVTESRRAEARIALFQAGLIGGGALIKPMADSLGVTLGGNAEQVIAGSAPLKAAITDTVRVGAAAETARIQGRYQTALAALAALVVEQGKLGQERGISLAEVDRLLDAITASLAVDAPPPNPDQTPTPAAPVEE